MKENFIKTHFPILKLKKKALRHLGMSYQETEKEVLDKINSLIYKQLKQAYYG